MLITSKFIKRYLGFEFLSLRHGVLPAENLRVISSNNREKCGISAIFRPEKLPEKNLNQGYEESMCPLFSDSHFGGLFSPPTKSESFAMQKRMAGDVACGSITLFNGVSVTALRVCRGQAVQNGGFCLFQIE